MEPIEMKVSGSAAVVTREQPVVSGTVGLPVKFSFDESWQGLEKTAVFRVNGTVMDQIHIAAETVVPWELLTKPGCRLWCGVYGCNSSGSVQVPTVWADLGIVEPGAEPSGDVSSEPTLPVWQQLTEEVEKALDEILKLQQSIIQGILPTGGEDL